MKKRVLGIIAMILAVAMVLCSCKVGKKSVELTDDALAAEVLIDFAKGRKQLRLVDPRIANKVTTFID